MAKYAAKEICKIRKMVTFLFCRPFDDTVACHFVTPSDINEFVSQPSQLKNCLVPVDMKNTIGCLGKNLN